MKWITLLAVLAMVLDSIFGTQSSVGGPLTMLLIVFLTMPASLHHHIGTPLATADAGPQHMT